MENHELRTSALWDMLFKAPSAESFLEGIGDETCMIAFHRYIGALCERRGEAPDRVIRRADIEKSYGHSLFRGRRSPSRDTVLQLAFGFCADFELAQALLKHAGHSPLYPRVPRDVLIGYCLAHRRSLQEAQTMLLENGLPLIGRAAK